MKTLIVLCGTLCITLSVTLCGLLWITVTEMNKPHTIEVVKIDAPEGAPRMVGVKFRGTWHVVADCR